VFSATFSMTPASSTLWSLSSKRPDETPPPKGNSQMLSQPPNARPPPPKGISQPPNARPPPRGSSVNCPQCGTPVTARFCTSCGFNLSTVQTEEEPEPPINVKLPPKTQSTRLAPRIQQPPSSINGNSVNECQQCGESNPPASKFCTACGSVISASPLSLPPQRIKEVPSTSSTGDIGGFLKQRNVDESVIAILQKEKVTLSNMGDLDHEALKAFGISVWGDRAAVLNAIKSYP